MRRRRYEVTEMYALIEISNQMLEDSAFDHSDASLRKAGLAVPALQPTHGGSLCLFTTASHSALLPAP
jgi:hypothetical protein